MNETPHSMDMKLQEQIAKLSGTVEAGFEAVNKRLDISNGRLGKHDDLFSTILANDSFQAGRRKGLTTAWSIFLSVITVVLATLAIYFHSQ